MNTVVRPTARVMPRMVSAGNWWASVDSAWEQEKTQSQKRLEKRAASHLSAAPWHDGERSFSTKERLVVYTRKMQKGVVFQKMAHFPRFPGEVLRTLCWAVFALYSIL